jgi:hypothetical protein
MRQLRDLVLGVHAMSKTSLDSIVFGGLALALLFVIGLDRILPVPSSSTGKLEAIAPGPSLPRAKQLRLAVSQTNKDEWDKMGELLDGLGKGYKYEYVNVNDLYNAKRFDDFDVLFLTCSSVGNDKAIADNIRQFVANGGTLYASDWRFIVVAYAFPDMVDKNAQGEGKDQKLVADVVDPGLKDALGTDKLPLKFDLDQWKTAAFSGDRVKVLVKAPRYIVQPPKDAPDDAPPQYKSTNLLVKFNFGKGAVIFTSFHNEAQNSEIEQKLLKYLVFSAVTAQIENEAHQTMLKGGFSPQKSNLLSASGKAEMSHTYKSQKPGQVRFILGFQEGARLKLSVTSPDGKTQVKEGTSSFTVEESCPVVGEWRYTITALEVPFPDFPFTLTVGESQ